MNHRRAREGGDRSEQFVLPGKMERGVCAVEAALVAPQQDHLGRDLVGGQIKFVSDPRRLEWDGTESLLGQPRVEPSCKVRAEAARTIVKQPALLW